MLVLSLSVSANSYSNAKRRGGQTRRTLIYIRNKGLKKIEKQRLQLVLYSVVHFMATVVCLLVLQLK